VTLRINEGRPIMVTEMTVTQMTPIGKSAILSRRELGRSRRLRRNQPFNLLQLDSTRSLLQTAMWEHGYSDAVVDTSVQYDSSGYNAKILMRIDPRWQARVATLELRGIEKIEDSTIYKSLSFKPGDIFKRSAVLESQRSLYESNLFRRAVISVPEEDDSLKHVTVTVQEAPPRDVRLSAGFNTIDFVQAEGRYTNYNWFGKARRFTASAVVGNLFAPQLNGSGIFYDVSKTAVGGSAGKYLSPTFTASLESRRPWFMSPKNEIAIGLFGHRRSSPGIYVDYGYGASATFTRTVTERAPISLNYRFEETKVDAGDVYFCINFGICDATTLNALRQNQRLSPLALSASIDRTDNALSPRRGVRGQLDAEVASKFTASDFRYGRMSVEAAGFYPVMRRSVLGGRIRLGYVKAFESTADAVGADATATDGLLHPRKRFYSGGSQSVRGFGESQLGPRVLTIPFDKLHADTLTCPVGVATVDCNPNLGALKDRDFEPRPLGGNILAEASIELRFPIITDLTGAVFIDGAYLGQVIDDDLPKSQTAVTPGIGVRYNSPVGPIRVDMGLNPVTRQDLPVVTEDTTGGVRKLVRLNAERSYSPFKSGISGLLSRLTLHLSIGEAF
jgi:outer membrane protein insertion porin family